jgi:hypothetical protein
MRALITVLVLALAAGVPGSAGAADDTKVKAATGQVESGAKAIGEGKVGKGVEQTAKGVGNTVVEGAKYSGEKLKDAGKAAEAPAKTSWEHVKQGANSFGQSVKSFFARLFD